MSSSDSKPMGNGGGNGPTVVVVPPPPVRRTRYTREQKLHALQLVDMGQSYRAAASEVSPFLNPATISLWIKQRERDYQRQVELGRYRRSLKKKT